MNAFSPKPFGTYAPTPRQEWCRDQSRRFAGSQKLLASLFAKGTGRKQRRPRDVTVFDGQKVRLHPYDNLCEKRVYTAWEQWDRPERDHLADHIKNTSADDFVFVDAGANVGLYSIFVDGAVKAAGRTPRIVAIEPDPTVGERLRTNIMLSKAAIDVHPFAITPEEQMVRILTHDGNRGETRIDLSQGTPDAKPHDGNIEVPGKPLAMILREAGLSHVDALKIDIEGQEGPIIAAFLEQAEEALWPSMIVMEMAHYVEGPNALEECLKRGYRQTMASKLNTVLVRD